MPHIRLPKAFILALLFTLNLGVVAHAQIITTYAGISSNVFSGDGGPASSAGLYFPVGLAYDTIGNLFIVDGNHFRIRKVTPAGIISTVAGNGSFGYSGDGGPATNAQFNAVYYIKTDRFGNFFIADHYCHRIRKINAAGIITTVAGNGTLGYSGDGGPATSAAIVAERFALDYNGNLYISGGKIRKVDRVTGIISYFAGNGSGVYSGDGGPATAAGFDSSEIAIDKTGNIYLVSDARIRKIDTSGIINTIAGHGVVGYGGDGGPATAALFTHVSNFSVDDAGCIYFTDFYNQVVRKINAIGIISTIAGNGTSGFMGDGGPATAAGLNYICDVIKNNGGNIFIAERNSNRVRMVTDTNHVVHFNTGTARHLNVCAEATVSLDTLLAVTDIDPSQVIKWRLVSGPSHGVVAASASAVTTTGAVMPSGTTYSALGYIGYDTFVVQATDGYSKENITVYLRNDVALPVPGGISGPDTICVNHVGILTDTVSGGVWTSSNSKATVSGGIVTGIAPGKDTISYTVTNACGTATTSHVVYFKVCPAAVSTTSSAMPNIKVYPSPNNGSFTIFVTSPTIEEARIVITNMMGVKVKELNTNTIAAIKMDLTEPAGIYCITLTTLSGTWSSKVVIDRN